MALAGGAASALGRLIEGASEIAKCSDTGLRLLAELYVEEVALCEQWGNSRPEEGSEHYLAYCIEDLAGKGFVHGSLVGLCAVATAKWQEMACVCHTSPELDAALGQSFDAEQLAAFLRDAKLNCSLEAVGVTRAQLRAALLRAGTFVQAEKQLLPGVFHFAPVPEDKVDDLLEFIEAQARGA